MSRRYRHCYSVSTSRTRVLVVEDEQDIADLVKHALERDGGIDVQIVNSGDTAVAVATQAVPDLMVLDLNLPATYRARSLPAASRKGGNA